MKWQQTNTADMLDLAVDYIKDLQKQFQVMTKKSKRKKAFFFIKDSHESHSLSNIYICSPNLLLFNADTDR